MDTESKIIENALRATFKDWTVETEDEDRAANKRRLVNCISECLSKKKIETGAEYNIQEAQQAIAAAMVTLLDDDYSKLDHSKVEDNTKLLNSMKFLDKVLANPLAVEILDRSIDSICSKKAGQTIASGLRNDVQPKYYPNLSGEMKNKITQKILPALVDKSQEELANNRRILLDNIEFSLIDKLRERGTGLKFSNPINMVKSAIKVVKKIVTDDSNSRKNGDWTISDRDLNHIANQITSDDILRSRAEHSR